MTMHWLSQQLGQLVKLAKQVNTKENCNHEGYELQTAKTHSKVELRIWRQGGLMRANIPVTILQQIRLITAEHKPTSTQLVECRRCEAYIGGMGKERASRGCSWVGDLDQEYMIHGDRMPCQVIIWYNRLPRCHHF